uniref:Uncharacterized protein n=1 Tax=Nelumbo nucifera TaxID=4432 RepID=A0A822ZL21_NELNU|nr:TPA_asm: hypothetical protein HUJ06_002365 [Nelumbo nucifera]
MLKLPKSFLFSGNGGGVLQGTTYEAILCTFTAARDRTSNRIGRENIGKLVVYGLDQTHFRAVAMTVDPIAPLCAVAKEYGVWVHIDAVYVGSACICPEFKHFIDGVEDVDSFSFNAHKWFFTTLYCCCLWVKYPSTLVKALSTSLEYLRNKATESKQVIDYKDWQNSPQSSISEP